ncbi:uncharacterized protein BCR38DRAFT_519551 [Pseudomassariella vexata]|uniref:Urease accessory protein UreD n=1 Tax=Pseudomassariella vexata TaxID=1141098 RepID=A0A1Y2EI20_9PEZI|nr:uncharacterized protein BCR38DRAFT_519551 [Pseudomassariella vexata]ORY71087.1 hypothetical protein BCR38DRAFT_519551 [Pseudomassariella vexata]
MPHKHTRREKDLSTFNLPPTQFAKPLPVTQLKNDWRAKRKNGKSKNLASEPQINQKRKREPTQKDDAPRAFKRLMAFADGKKPPSGLDNGTSSKPKSKKNKKAVVDATGTEAAETSRAAESTETKNRLEIPTIRPGERMSEFAARVDAALPLSGLINKTARTGNDPLKLKVWRTKKEMQMHKLYDEWRTEEQKIKEKREEELELAEEKDQEEQELGVTWKVDAQVGAKGKKKKKGKRSKYAGEAAEPEEDPWAELKRKRGETRPGLHDVAKAPPELHKKLPHRLTVRGAAVAVDGIPKAAGSLRRREELQEVRDDVVAQYRKLMEGKRPSLYQTQDSES